MIKKTIIFTAAILILLAFAPLISSEAYAVMPIRLVVNGRDITHLSAPVLDNNRTLVPVRFVSEELGAKVEWDNVNKAVTIEKDGKRIVLVIGSRIMQLNGGSSAMAADVAPRIINDRTYVPLRVISNAFEIGIEWKNESRTVYVDSSKSSKPEPFYNMKITSPLSGNKITGAASITFNIGSQELSKGSDLRVMLLDRSNHKGYVIARTNAASGAASYVPKVEDNGSKILAAALYDSNGILVAADAIPVTVEVIPQVSIGGLTDGAVVTGTVQLIPQVNFSPHSVSYLMTNIETGKTIEFKEQQTTLKDSS